MTRLQTANESAPDRRPGVPRVRLLRAVRCAEMIRSEWLQFLDLLNPGLLLAVG